MKRLLALLIFCACALVSNGQELDMNINEPQLWFYEKHVPSIEENLNDAEEYRQLVYLCNTDDRISGTALLDMLYRIYEIENTSQIIYSTVDNMPIPFNNTYDFRDNIDVDFGSKIIVNERYGKVIDEDFAEYALRFASPVTKIDPNLFNSNMNIIVLPSIQNMSYTSSPNIMTNHLSVIKGYDVLDYISLISKDNTLIVAATASHLVYKVPDMVTKIGAGALRGSTAWEVIIPENVKSIGDRAFDKTLIADYYFLSDEAPILGESVFGDIMNANVMIYVPKKALRKYKNAWKPLKKHIKSMPKNIDLCAGEAFDPLSAYIMCSGLELTTDNKIVNKNNRFLAKGECVYLKEHESFLWQCITSYLSVQSLAEKLSDYTYGSMSYEDAYNYCLGVLKGWYEKGLICK